MSYGKYGMKNIGAGMPNNMMGIAYNDPWFAAGALLAQNWNKNYEDRGNKKAIDAALAELSPTGNAQEQQMATQQFQGMQPQGDTLQGRNMLGIGAGYTVPTGKGLLGGEIPPAASNATATGTEVLSSIMPPEPESDEPSARELLGLQGMPQGTGLFGSIFPEKEEPKGGLFANVLGNYRLGGEGGPAVQSAVAQPEAAQEQAPTQGGLITNALINYHLNGGGSPLENTSSQIMRDYLARLLGRLFVGQGCAGEYGAE